MRYDNICYCICCPAAFSRRSSSVNDRDEQIKLIKFNHVAARCSIFHNVQTLTRLPHQLAQEGLNCKDETLAQLSPYLTEHVNRFVAWMKITAPPISALRR